jgi:hypothetical protein
MQRYEILISDFYKQDIKKAEPKSSAFSTFI